MFKRIKKKTDGKEPFHSKWMEAFRRYQRKLCDRLQERTRHWSRQRKIMMLTLIIIFFGGFYLAILIKTIRSEEEKGMYPIHEPSFLKDSALIHHPEKFIPKNNQDKSPP